MAPEANPVPLIFISSAWLPAAALFGSSLVMVGDPVIENVANNDAVAELKVKLSPGITCTCAVPTFNKRAFGIVTTTVVEVGLGD